MAKTHSHYAVRLRTRSRGDGLVSAFVSSIVGAPSTATSSLALGSRREVRFWLMGRRMRADLPRVLGCCWLDQIMLSDLLVRQRDRRDSGGNAATGTPITKARGALPDQLSVLRNP